MFLDYLLRFFMQGPRFLVLQFDGMVGSTDVLLARRYFLLIRFFFFFCLPDFFFVLFTFVSIRIYNVGRYLLV